MRNVVLCKRENISSLLVCHLCEQADLEKIRARAQAKSMEKLATATHNANEKRATAEAKRKKEATRTAKQADYIRQNGHVPNQSFSCWSFCF